jgi:hypothetical protein
MGPVLTSTPLMVTVSPDCQSCHLAGVAGGVLVGDVVGGDIKCRLVGHEGRLR